MRCESVATTQGLLSMVETESRARGGGITLKDLSFLVTGGAGFIGSCFVREQLAGRVGHLVVLDKLSYAGSMDNLSPCLDADRFRFVQGDVADDQLVATLLREHHVDVIVHFAAETHVDRSIDDPWPFVHSNVVGSCRLLEAARRYWRELDEHHRRVFRMVHVSTDEVFGALEDEQGRFDADSAYRPNSPYAASKAAADHFARAYYQTYGFPVLVTYCTNNFGPYQFPEKMIPLMILNALSGRPLPVYGQGRQRRDWLYVEDHCRGLRLAVQYGVPGGRYFFASGQDRSNLEVVRAICATVDRLCPQLAHRPCETLITFVADRPGHDFRYALDTRATCQELGWSPDPDFLKHLEATVRWYMENRQWVDATRRRYQQQRLGLGQ
jgi:dTDP-glucose 4,6-dehydratase